MKANPASLRVDTRERRGVLGWELEAKPGETQEIKLGWRVRRPADRAVVHSLRAP